MPGKTQVLVAVPANLLRRLDVIRLALGRNGYAGLYLRLILFLRNVATVPEVGVAINPPVGKGMN